MKRNERIAAAVLLAACLLAALAYKGYESHLDAQVCHEIQEEEKSRTKAQEGDEVTIGTKDDREDSPFRGTMRVRVEDAVVFDGPDQARKEFDGWVEDAFYAGNYFSEGRQGEDFDLVLFRIHVSNVDAEPRHATKLGNQLFMIEGVAGLRPCIEHAYLDGPGTATKDAERGYFGIVPGSEGDYVFGYVVRRDDADKGSFTAGSWGYGGYEVPLAPRDLRGQS
ncbi:MULTISPECIES: hypothetical protein [Olsenella]|uniref:hypothetical protein n=1 Tax=Olsenella TaxID=133925 RepID=UPI000780603B|nr:MULTISPECIES: hypothetical protein [Olsenella]KXB64237.1 hypothetical protein HMPREF1868_00046 [Olsenella sp. DNF00959]